MSQTSTPRRGNPAGIASLVAGILLLLVGILVQSLMPALPTLVTESGLSPRLLPLLLSAPQAVIAIVATVLGVIGLVLRDRARVSAIIGTTIGASHLVVGVLGLLGAGVVTAVLS